MKAFLDKAPMTQLVAATPVHVILNEDAVLIGASVRASALADAGARR
jgi:glucokinase